MRHLTRFQLLAAGLALVFGAWGCTLTTESPDATPILITATPALVLPTASATPPIPAATAIALPTATPPIPAATPVSTVSPPPTITPVIALPTVTPLPPSIADEVAAVNAARMILTINQLVSFGNRHALAAPGTGAHAARDFLLAAFQSIQYENPQTPMLVYPHAFPFTFRDQTVLGENIVLVILGSDPGAGAWVIGAHYDTRSEDVAALYTAQPGADDNASGVAAVLEIAGILARHPRRATIYCVLFTAEEQGRFGSLAFVRDVIQAQNVPLRGMINLDIIGSPIGPDGVRRDQEVRFYSALPASSPSRALAGRIAQAVPVYVPGMAIILYDSLDRVDRWGDQQSFTDAGYAAVRLIEPADDMRRIHNANDLPDYLEPDYLRRVTQIALAAVLVLSAESAP
jgi:hypothetical protein